MANQKIEYAASAALTITLANLTQDASLLTGQESAAVDNTTNKYPDYLLAGKVTTGTNPTDAKQIRVYVYAQLEDTPTYPDVFDGTDSAETITSADIRNACVKLAAVMHTNDTSDRTYWFGPVSIASLFGGVVPKRWGVFVTHDTGVNLKNNAADQAIWQTPVYATVV